LYQEKSGNPADEPHRRRQKSLSMHQKKFLFCFQTFSLCHHIDFVIKARLHLDRTLKINPALCKCDSIFSVKAAKLNFFLPEGRIADSQGCQMEFLHTKNSFLVIFRALEWKMLVCVYFLALWNIFRPSGTYMYVVAIWHVPPPPFWYIVPGKNLATLADSSFTR
jgi:hypothetical protein